MPSSIRRSVDLSAYPDLVVIYLGYRARNLRGIGGLLRIGRGLRAIKRHPPEGLLAHENLLFGPLHPGFRQYWRDLESLEAFTRDTLHAGWWRDFGKDTGGGFWHETYRIGGGMEAIYLGMPVIGFGRFAPSQVPEGSFRTARQRLTATAERV
ncbi:MAG TPA: DUF4188 domain-containing protein [Stellaceae bacterium]|nr:DUF4188 domain-containing protein [Stellaceae bacterium]